MNVTRPGFRVDYLPDPPNPRARLALALYRDALEVNSEPFRFLGFYKIINVVRGTGPQQITWINARVNTLEDYRAKNALLNSGLQGATLGRTSMSQGDVRLRTHTATPS